MKLKIHSFIAVMTAGLFALPALAEQTKTTDADNLLSAYEKVSTALANDDLAAAKTSAATLAQQAGGVGNETIADGAATLAKSDSLEAAREHLKAISNEAVKLAEGSDTYHAMTCPMARAQWVQSGEKVMNPYMGTKMQQCGGMMKSKGGARTGGCCSMMNS